MTRASLALLFSLLACSQTPADPSADLATAAPDLAPDLATVRVDGDTNVLTMPAVTLAPGFETTVCVEVPLGNAAARLVRRVQVSLPQGSHHLIVYRSTATVAQPVPTPCQPFAGIQGGTAPLFIAQASNNDLVLPDNIGIHLNPQQMVRLEEHFLNASTQPITGTGTVTLTTIPEDGKATASDMMFWGSTAIVIPRKSPGQAEMFKKVRAGVSILGLTTHQHQFGTLATISQAQSAQGPATELYRNSNWAEPPLKRYDPPLTFDGSTGLKLHCEYNNTSNNTVTFGESAATNEMCFFWAYYYPSHGFDVAF